MVNFKAHVLYGTKLLQVQFSRIAAPGSKFFVEMSSEGELVACFEMQRDQFNKWKVTNPVHEWVLTLENQLAHAIHNNHLISC